MGRELAWRLFEVRAPLAEVNSSRIHSFRLPGYTIGLEVRFGQKTSA